MDIKRNKVTRSHSIHKSKSPPKLTHTHTTGHGMVKTVECTVQDVKDRYKFSHRALGKGATSVVRVAETRSSGQRVAIKQINLSGLDQRALSKLLNEVEIMKTLDHPNIVKLLRVMRTSHYMFLVMELCTGGELYDALASRGAYSMRNVASLTEQMLSAIRYCHSKGIVHRVQVGKLCV